MTKPKRSTARRTISFFWSASLLAAFIFAGFQIGSFVRYAHVVTSPVADDFQHADAIVVLTGGENRIRAATALLREQTDKRLLISGVNPDTSEQSLLTLSGVDQNLFDCCIDIDRSARDTIDNAIETSKWAEVHGAQSLIVVTSAFHMPRAMIEFSHAMPDRTLIPVAVNVPDGTDWWREEGRMRDLMREFAKLSFVRARDVMNGITGAPWPNMLMRKSIAEEQRQVKVPNTS